MPATDEVFARYLDPAFGYVKSRNPARARSREDALRDGLNCVALAHLVMRELFGYPLPARLQALELARDLAHFGPVPNPGRMRAGDLVWLGTDRPRAGLDEFVPQYDGDELVNGSDVPSGTSPSAPAPVMTVTTSCCTPAPWTAPTPCGRCGGSVTTTGTGGFTRPGGCGRSSGTRGYPVCPVCPACPDQWTQGRPRRMPALVRDAGRGQG